jgi:hypothetical protein
MRTAFLFFLLSIVGLISGIKGLCLADFNEAPLQVSVETLQKLEVVENRWVKVKAFPYWQEALVAYPQSAMPEHFIQYLKETPEEKKKREKRIPDYYLLPLTLKQDVYHPDKAVFVYSKNKTRFKTAGENNKAVEIEGLLRNDVNNLPEELGRMLEKMKLQKAFSGNKIFLEEGLRPGTRNAYYALTGISGLTLAGSILWLIFNYKRKRMPDEIEESSGRPF